MDRRDQNDQQSLAEKFLPQNVEAEAGVLGSILIDPASMGQIADTLRPEDFYRDQYRTIYAAIRDLWRAHTPADLITLTDELARRGKLDGPDGVGGASYVSSLSNQVPTSANIESYAAIVERTAILRRLIHAAGQIAGVAYNEPDADVALDQAERLLWDVRQSDARRRADDDSVPFEDAVDSWLDEQMAVIRAGGAPTGVRYGLDALDRVLLGIKPGELVYLCGRPGAGKSALAADIALRVATHCADESQQGGQQGGEGDGQRQQGGTCGTVEYLTFEMRQEQVVGRLIAAHAGINTHALRANFRRRDGTLDEQAWQQACDAAVALQMRVRAHLRLKTRRQRIADIRRHLERAVAQRGCGFAIVDYLGLVTPGDAEQRMSEYQRISNLSRELKQLAFDLRIPVLCLVQMSRASEGRADPRPVMSDLRDSGQLEQDADAIIGLVRMASYLPRLAQANEHFAQFTEAHLLKVREGAQAGSVVPLRFEAQYTRFTDWPSEWGYGSFLTLTKSDDGQAPAADATASQGAQGEGRDEGEWR